MITFNILLDGLCKAQCLEDVLELFDKAGVYGVELDIASFSTIWSGCFRYGKFKLAGNMFDEIAIRGLSPDVIAYNSYIYWLCKKGLCEKANDMFI